MLAKETLDFLRELELSNNREWFTAHKKDFEKAKENIAAFVGYLIGEISKFDPAIGGLQPDACVFRIYRDVRFSKDKSPYKTNLGAYLSPGGRKSMGPGYYFHLQPGKSFIAGGKHMPDSPELLKIRTAIAEDTDGFLKILNKKSCRDTFGEMRGDRLKTAPKGFDPAHKAIEMLKLKEFMAYTEFPDDAFVTSPEFPKHLVKTCREMYPLVTFLRSALVP